LGQLIAELIRFFLPGLDEEQIADLMEEVLPTSETTPLQVDTEELKAVLEGDAVIFEERQQRDREVDCPNGPRAMEFEIAEQAAKLRQVAQKKKLNKATQAAVAPEGRPDDHAGAPGSADNTTDTVATVVGKSRHWTGKGGAHWTAQVHDYFLECSFTLQYYNFSTH
jgi:hypothetical protein